MKTGRSWKERQFSQQNFPILTQNNLHKYRLVGSVYLSSPNTALLVRAVIIKLTRRWKGLIGDWEIIDRGIAEEEIREKAFEGIF